MNLLNMLMPGQGIGGPYRNPPMPNQGGARNEGGGWPGLGQWGNTGGMGMGNGGQRPKFSADINPYNSQYDINRGQQQRQTPYTKMPIWSDAGQFYTQYRLNPSSFLPQPSSQNNAADINIGPRSAQGLRGQQMGLPMGQPMTAPTYNPRYGSRGNSWGY